MLSVRTSYQEPCCCMFSNYSGHSLFWESFLTLCRHLWTVMHGILGVLVVSGGSCHRLDSCVYWRVVFLCSHAHISNGMRVCKRRVHSITSSLTVSTTLRIRLQCHHLDEYLIWRCLYHSIQFHGHLKGISICLPCKIMGYSHGCDMLRYRYIHSLST